MDASQAGTDVRTRLREIEHAVEKISPVRLAGGAGIIASVVVLLATAIVLAGTAAKVLAYAESANSVQRTLNTIDALQEAMSNASVAAREYMVSRNPRVAVARDQAAKDVRRQLGDLDTALASDSAMTREIRLARGLISRRLDMFNQVNANGAPPSPQWELTRIQLIQRTNSIIASLRIRAAGELSYHQKRIAANIRIAIGLALFAAATAPLLGLAGIALLRRERDSRRARELQMELMHVQRLAVMGETSTMLAHEINQPLTAAANYLAVLKRHIDGGATDAAAEIAERIGLQIQRASAILKKLRRFVEKRETERSLEAPETLVEDALTLLGTLDPMIHLETRIDSGLPDVLVDRVQMQQVLVNLLRNAIEAMDTMPHRELHLSVTGHGDHFIEISLADSGPGLKPEIAARLFQPFVTSKSGGMGVGLSISRSIIEQHGGRIWAESNPAGGAVFLLTLPSVTERRAISA